MNYWKILGIEPTTDKNIIKQSYMEKLNLFHPEEDPEGFQNLRQAYETALKECDVEEEVDNSPVGLWIQNVKEVYSRLSTRINPDVWNELLQDEICFQIDMVQETSYKLLTFLMDNFRMPQKVWHLLDEHFNWSEKSEELYNKFPPAFINFLLEVIQYEECIPYEWFSGDDDADYDEWFKLYFALSDSVSERDDEKTEEILNEIKETGIEHPFVTKLEIRYWMQSGSSGDKENARILAGCLLERYPNNIDFLYTKAQAELTVKEAIVAKEYYEKIIEIDDQHVGSIIGLGNCYIELEDFLLALEYFEKARVMYPYNNYIRERLYIVREGLVNYHKNKLEEEPNNEEFLFDLAWACYDANKIDICKELAEKIVITDDNKANYYNLMGSINSELGKYNKALEYFMLWFDVKHDESKENYMYKKISNQFELLGEYEKCLKVCDKVLEDYPDSDKILIIDILNRKSYSLNKLEKYEEAISVCDEGLEIDEGIAHLYLNKAEALYNLNNYRDAMDNCFSVNNIYPYFIDNYLIQIKIYFNVGEYENAMQVIERVEEYKLDTLEVKLYKAKILSITEKIEEAKELYLNLLQEYPDNERLYYDLTYFNMDLENYDNALYYINKSIQLKDNIDKQYLLASVYKKKNLYDNALETYFNIIEQDAEASYAYNNIGLIYSERGEYEKAIKNLKTALEIDSTHPTVNNNLGEVYEKLEKYEEALEYYNKQLAIEEDDYYYINRAWCYIRLRNFEEAKKDFSTVINANNENMYAWYGLGRVYKILKEYETAIENFKKVLELNIEYKYAYRDIGESYEQLKNYEESEKCYTEAIEKFPDDETFYLDRGLLYSNQDKYDKALEDYNKAIEINPNYAYAYNNMGVVYRDLKQYDKAIKYYHKALEIQPEYALCTNNLAFAYKKLKQYNKALKYYHKALKLGYHYANNNIGDLYLYNLKEYRKAIEFYKKEIESGKYPSKDADIYKSLATAYYELGEMSKAKHNYKLALRYYLEDIKYDENSACLHENIGFCYEHLENYEEAIEYYNKAIELALQECNCSKKQCHEGYYRLGKISEAKNNIEEAIKYYNKALEIDPEDEDYQEAVKKFKNSSPMDKIKDIINKLKKNK